jgi:hypothetical protein
LFHEAVADQTGAKDFESEEKNVAKCTQVKIDFDLEANDE